MTHLPDESNKVLSHEVVSNLKISWCAEIDSALSRRCMMRGVVAKLRRKGVKVQDGTRGILGTGTSSERSEVLYSGRSNLYGFFASFQNIALACHSESNSIVTYKDVNQSEVPP